MENKSWVLMMVGLFFAIICVAGITYTSKNNKTGAWEVAGSWAGAKPSNTAIGSDDIINIDGYVTRNGNYDVSGDATIHIYDTLVITGDLTMSQLSTNTGIKVHAGGLLIVLGNFSSNNSGGNLLDVQAGGRAVIVKNYDQKQGVVKAAGDLYVFDDTPTFSWGSSVDGTNYNGSNGPLASKLDDETDLVSNDKSLAKFLESLGVGTLICSATPTYISKTGTGNWTAAGSWSGTKPSYTLTGGSYTFPQTRSLQ